MIVADTNLLVYFHLPGEHNEAADHVLRADRDWAAPLLWRSEFRNVLALYLRKGLLEIDAAITAFQGAEATIEEREFSIETAHVLNLVNQSACSAYDCEFAALSYELGVPLVTSDKGLLSNFPDIAVAPANFASK